MNYWAAIHLPVIVCLVDVNTELQSTAHADRRLRRTAKSPRLRRESRPTRSARSRGALCNAPSPIPFAGGRRPDPNSNANLERDTVGRSARLLPAPMLRDRFKRRFALCCERGLRVQFEQENVAVVTGQ
jgi:hypothetical protein